MATRLISRVMSLVFFGCALSLAPQQTKAQTATGTPGEIIDQFMEALGGEMTLLGVESLAVNYTVKGDTLAHGTIKFLDGKTLRKMTIESIADVDYTVCFDGKKWIRTSQTGEASVDVDKKSIALNESVFDLPTVVLRWRQYTDEFKIVPHGEYAKSEYSHCACLSLSGETFEIRRYFDPEAHLMMCMERIEIRESGARRLGLKATYEYREIEGLQFVAKSRRSNDDGWSCNIEYTDFSINPELDEADFHFELDVDRLDF